MYTKMTLKWSNMRLAEISDPNLLQSGNPLQIVQPAGLGWADGQLWAKIEICNDLLPLSHLHLRAGGSRRTPASSEPRIRRSAACRAWPAPSGLRRIQSRRERRARPSRRRTWWRASPSCPSGGPSRWVRPGRTPSQCGRRARSRRRKPTANCSSTSDRLECSVCATHRPSGASELLAQRPAQRRLRRMKSA